MSFNRGLDKEEVAHIHNVYCRKDGTLPFARTWMDLGMTILREISQRPKDKNHTISLT